jgi:hypothetical protein
MVFMHGTDGTRGREDVRIPHADTKWYSRADWPRTKENLVDWAKTAYT